MAVASKTELIVDRRFDPKRYRHSVNGATHVLHCHHYTTLYTQLAEDCGMLDGKKLLREVTEDSILEVLRNYYREHEIESIADRITIAEQYFAFTGLGKMKVTCAGPESGEVALLHSHLDEGWIKKFGRREEPVNHIGSGYVTALFSAVFDRPARSYSAIETESIVSGASRSTFVVVAS